VLLSYKFVPSGGQFIKYCCGYSMEVLYNYVLIICFEINHILGLGFNIPDNTPLCFSHGMK